MFNPRVEAGEGNNNGDKGKRKMLFPSYPDMDTPAPFSTGFKSFELLEGKLCGPSNEIKSPNQRFEQSRAKPGAGESSEQTEWDDPIAVEFEKLIISNLRDAFRSAIKKIVEGGYTEEQAEWAVLNSGVYHGGKDFTSNIVSGALEFLSFHKDFATGAPQIFDGLESLVNYLMLEMVNVVKEVKPSLTVADAMWLLLVSDLNMQNASQRDTQHLFKSQDNLVKCSCCAARLSQLRKEAPRGTAPQSSEISHSCEFTISGKQSSVLLPAMEGTSSGSSRGSLLSAASQASGTGRKGSSVYSMKELLGQKTTRCEKGKGRKGKAFFKTRVTTSVDVTLGKPLNSQPSPSGGKNKGSSFKINSKGEIVCTLPAVSSKAPAVVQQESKAIWKGNISVSSSVAPGNNAGIPSDVSLQSSLPMTDKDEMIAWLKERKHLMEKELQDWTDWANVKVGQAAQKLKNNQAELKLLRQEREDAAKGKAVMDENTMKRFSEVEQALSNAASQMEAANSADRRLEAERTMLKKGLQDSYLKALQSSKELHEAKVRLQEVVKQCPTMEAEISILQGELAGLKVEESNLQTKIEKARRRKNEFEVLRQHEEREKMKFLRQAESIKREREEMMHQTEVEEANMMAKAEANRLMMEEHISQLIAEISALKLKTEVSKVEAVKREWECVMCLTKEKSVVFLPCAHQVLCTECNALHEKKGMKDCPCCRTPISKRISARFVHPKAQ